MLLSIQKSYSSPPTYSIQKLYNFPSLQSIHPLHSENLLLSIHLFHPETPHLSIHLLHQETSLQIHHPTPSRNTTHLKSTHPSRILLGQLGQNICWVSAFLQPHCRMEAEDNPVRMLRKSKHKTIEDLKKNVSANQSAVEKLWKLKEKEKKFWRTGLCEKEVGWCCVTHRNFCDVDSKCKPWDPIPARSSEGRLTDIKNRCFSSWMNIKMFPFLRQSLMT